jgi:hypothetical protein
MLHWLNPFELITNAAFDHDQKFLYLFHHNRHSEHWTKTEGGVPTYMSLSLLGFVALWSQEGKG